MKRIIVLLAGFLTACTTSVGTVGVMRRNAGDVGVKLLRPGVTGRSCRASLVGLPLSGSPPDLREALEEIFGLDAEGDMVVNAEVRWQQLLTGLYNRRCIEVQGDLARTVSTIIIPAPAEHHGH